jgi:signal transduction histidine kinase
VLQARLPISPWDSLTVHLQALPPDSASVNTYISFVKQYTGKNPLQALQWAEQAVAMAQQVAYKRGEAILLTQVAEIYQRKGLYANAMDYANRSLRLASEIPDSVLIAQAYFVMGIIYTDGLRQYEPAIRNAEAALPLFRAAGDAEGIANAFNLLAWSYAMQEQKTDEAMQLIDSAILISRKMPDVADYEGYYLGTKALLFGKTGQTDSALRYFEYANRLIAEDFAIVAYYNNLSGDLRRQTRDYRGALLNYQKALELSQRVNAREFKKDALNGLAHVYATLGNYELAYNYHTEAHLLQDTIANWQVSQQIAIMENQLINERNEARIALLEQEKQAEMTQRRYMFIIASIIIAALLTVLALEMYRGWQRKQLNTTLAHKNKKLRARNRQIKAQKRSLIAQAERIGEQNRQLHEHNEELFLLNEELQQQKEEIETLNEHLEKKVHERTEELHHTVQSLVAQNEDLRQFSYIISHNLRAPVARILSLVEIFNREKPDDEINLIALEHLQLAGHSLDSIIHDLNNIIGIRKDLSAEREWVQLEQIVATGLAHLESEIQQADAEIDIQLEVHEVYTIKVYMQSILYNLLSNAVKFRHPQRRLKLSVRSQLCDRGWELQLSDNGQGVDTSQPYKIFGLYQRMHTHVEGKGFGLYLVKTQVEAMNGHIEVRSTPDQGATFSISFPHGGSA